jgi:hypothetical protein
MGRPIVSPSIRRRSFFSFMICRTFLGLVIRNVAKAGKPCLHLGLLPIRDTDSRFRGVLRAENVYKVSIGLKGAGDQMRHSRIVVMFAALFAVRELGFDLTASMFALSLTSAAFLLESLGDFESVAASLAGKGKQAKAPAQIVGKSGVKHEFSLAEFSKSGGDPEVVVDAELSVKDVDEMRVLKFYVKVFDVSPKKSILCVCPRLTERASSLAKEYGITVLESDVPRKLVQMAANEIIGTPGGK